MREIRYNYIDKYINLLILLAIALIYKRFHNHEIALSYIEVKYK